MRAFVTGATGFIGNRVARALTSRGWDVTALVRTPAKAQPLIDLGVTIAPGDVTDPASLKAMHGHDAVFHLAAWYAIGARDRERMEQVNVGGTINVLDAAAEASIPRVVHCSTVAAIGTIPDGGVGDENTEHHGQFGSIYEETKGEAHRIASERAAGGLPVVIAMPGATYGIGDNSMVGVLLKLYAKRLLIACPFQETGLSWVHVEDVANGIVLAHDKGRIGEEYLITGDNDTIGNLFRRIRPIVRRRPPMRMPNGLVRAAVPLGPLVAKILGQEPNLLKEGLTSLTGSWMYSSAKAQRELGYTFRSIEDGIPPVIEEMRGKKPA